MDSMEDKWNGTTSSIESSDESAFNVLETSKDTKVCQENRMTQAH
jgi:hypothetical protein